MNAIVLLSSRQSKFSKDDLPMAFEAPANDDRLTELGAIFGAEQALGVSFTGISAGEALRALASFPGGRRCVLADA
jgi:hypothetical protein